jgi:hypothetical protein
MTTQIKMVHWMPRVICILAILFISMFALDSFDQKLTFWQQMGEFLIHLIPTYILVVLLVIAWKWELTGGIIFMVIGLGFSPFVFNMNYHMNHSVFMSLGIILMINFPLILTGGLFILSHFLKRK